MREMRKPGTDLRESEGESLPAYEESVAGTELSYQSSFSSLGQPSPSQSLRKPLLRLSPSQDLIFSPNSYGDLTARIQMSNMSPGLVAYKVKTTTPERFKVRPSNGCLRPGESSRMDISVTKSHMSQSGNLGRIMLNNLSLPHLSPLISHRSAGQVSHLRHLCVRRGFGPTSN